MHSKPYSPQGRGKQERLNRFIRERFLTEATNQGIGSLDELNDRFEAWSALVCNTRIHAETGQAPIDRWQAGGTPRHPDRALLADAFRWAAKRKVTRTATISLEGNNYAVDPGLVARSIEVRYDPEDLTRLDVYYEGRPAGVATPFKIGRHVAKAVPQAVRPTPIPTGIDYLGLIQDRHEHDTIATIAYRDAPLFDPDQPNPDQPNPDQPNPDDSDAGGTP